MQIAAYFDMDHATVLYAVRKVDDWVQMNTIEGFEAKEILSKL